jgi:hypothetical protein
MTTGASQRSQLPRSFVEARPRYQFVRGIGEGEWALEKRVMGVLESAAGPALGPGAAIHALPGAAAASAAPPRPRVPSPPGAPPPRPQARSGPSCSPGTRRPATLSPSRRWCARRGWRGRRAPRAGRAAAQKLDNPRARACVQARAPCANPPARHAPPPCHACAQEREYVSKYVESEIINHSSLRHPHVVCFREVFLSRGHINM